MAYKSIQEFLAMQIFLALRRTRVACKVPGMSMHLRIKERRTALGLSLEGLGRLVGVSWQTVQQWEKEDGTAPLRKRRDKLCEALGVSAEWLETGHEPPSIEPAKDGSILVSVRGSEELALELYRGLTPEQQRELLKTLRSVNDANRTTQSLMVKKLRTISNSRVDETFGPPPKKAKTP